MHLGLSSTTPMHLGLSSAYKFLISLLQAFDADLVWQPIPVHTVSLADDTVSG